VPVLIDRTLKAARIINRVGGTITRRDSAIWVLRRARALGQPWDCPSFWGIASHPVPTSFPLTSDQSWPI
jgi:hypothetical protein